MSIEELIEECNDECRACQRSFQKDDIEFSPSMCRYCPTGQKLHELLKRQDTSEQQWDLIDWSSSPWKDYYHG